MKTLLLSLLLLVSANTFSQTKAQMDEIYRSIYEIPLPKLAGTWKMYSIEVGAKTYYSSKIEAHINDMYANSLALNKDTLSEQDAAQIHKKIVDLLESALNVSYEFWSRKYAVIDKNGDKINGEVEYNKQLDEITLRNSKTYKKITYKIASLTDKKLVLISVDYDGKEGQPVTFIK